jgi:hypothetical protein
MHVITLAVILVCLVCHTASLVQTVQTYQTLRTAQTVRAGQTLFEIMVPCQLLHATGLRFRLANESSYLYATGLQLESGILVNVSRQCQNWPHTTA